MSQNLSRIKWASLRDEAWHGGGAHSTIRVAGCPCREVTGHGVTEYTQGMDYNRHSSLVIYRTIAQIIKYIEDNES